MRITFPFFQLENSANCNFDFLQIHDGDSASAHMLGKYCGQNNPAELYSSHNSLYFWFRSDHTINAGGFTVAWQSQDPGTVGGFSFILVNEWSQSLKDLEVWFKKLKVYKMRGLEFGTMLTVHRDDTLSRTHITPTPTIDKPYQLSQGCYRKNCETIAHHSLKSPSHLSMWRWPNCRLRQH